jgi:hypothetical protein
MSLSFIILVELTLATVTHAECVLANNKLHRLQVPIIVI